MMMRVDCPDRIYEPSDDQRRVRSVSADRVLDGDCPRLDSLSPDQRRVRSVSADRVLEGEGSRHESVSSLHTLDSQSSSKTWGGPRATYRAGYLHRRPWRSSWIGSRSLSTTNDCQNGR